MKRYFFEQYDGKKHLENDLTKLCIAMNRCNELKPSDNKLPAFEIQWIADAVAPIKLYKYCISVIMLQQLKQLLSWWHSCDFTVEETLSKAVSNYGYII